MIRWISTFINGAFIENSAPYQICSWRPPCWEGLPFNKCIYVYIHIMLRLKPKGRRSEQAGLEERSNSCILVNINYSCEFTMFRHANLGTFTGRQASVWPILSSSRWGRSLADDTRSSRPRTPQCREKHFGHITCALFWMTHNWWIFTISLLIRWILG